jgi:hypothetical protein
MADVRAPATPPEHLDLSESVAGEEDPGADIELAIAVASQSSSPSSAAPAPPMAPGDEAPAGTPGTGEDICRACGGSGILNGSPCPECEGTGKVTQAIGGA